MIYVAKPPVPERHRLEYYLDQVYDSRQLTNNGPLVQLFTERLGQFLGIKNLLLVSNGTLALQIALAALGIKKHGANVVTTPFSFVATTSSIVWESLQPRFADIDAKSLCLDPVKLSAVIDKNTRAVLPVHVYGNACDIDAIESVAYRAGLRTLYDGSHCFGVRFKGKSILECGDASTLSLHATKLFHCVEGGLITFRETKDLERARKMINFGYDKGQISCLGINAKMSELHAAFGLAMLDEVNILLEGRQRVWERYQKSFEHCVQLPRFHADATQNFSYFAIVLSDEATADRIEARCKSIGVIIRRYFSPSLNELAYIDHVQSCPVSESLSRRTVCLPVYGELAKDDQDRIISMVKLELTSETICQLAS
ncbi:DegT/DnrJ/EryC1/StrS family aminotransferase [bacterium]|nr:DegT/DnrJ/EryC1/StrS family aminotransferase [bacterium]